MLTEAVEDLGGDGPSLSLPHFCPLLLNSIPYVPTATTTASLNTSSLFHLSSLVCVTKTTVSVKMQMWWPLGGGVFKNY